MRARARLFNLPLAIDDSGGINVTQIRARARRHQRQHGLAALYIDYLGLMSMGAEYKSLVDQLGEAARALKNLGKELGVPVFLLHQINRGVEGRDDKRPSMADIRDSGKIEEHADIIILLYRDEYYLEINPPKRGPKETDEKFAERQVWHQRRMDEARGKADLIVAKYRNARRDTVTVGFNPVRQWFFDLSTTDGEMAHG
jgi:replicative DNA helicase